MEKIDVESEQIKDVYAHFGLAVYCGQVLEHGLVNALLVLDFIPSQRPRVRTRREWETTMDAFMDKRFEDTMGKLMKRLSAATTITPDLEGILLEALRKRNFLAHDFFRERAIDFMTFAGREQMLNEVDVCRELFKSADRALESILQPLRVQYGISDEALETEYQVMLTEGQSQK